jgi:beta-glucosidase
LSGWGFPPSRWPTAHGRAVVGGQFAITNSQPMQPAKVLTTSFPSGVAMAATWDTELVQREGQAIAQEVKALGRDMILGPTVNINRVPLWGRNFEGYGEDPYLASRWAWLTSRACRARA